MSSKLRFRSRQCAVFDDVLDCSELSKLNEFVLGETFEAVSISPEYGRGAISVSPQRGRTISYYSDDANYRAVDRNAANFPSDTPIDSLIVRIQALAESVPDIIGSQGVDWQHFTNTLWRYTQGCGFAPHLDGPNAYSGGYTFWFHQFWKLHWGGNLIIMHPDTNLSPVTRASGTIEKLRVLRRLREHSTRGDEASVWEPGLGLCVFPKPNRVIFIASDAPHMVTKIDPTAGEHLRLSVVGFFSRLTPSPDSSGCNLERS
jgi:hypothetical protein